MILLLIIALTVCFCFYWYKYVWNFYIEKMQSVPVAKPMIPFFGNAWVFKDTSKILEAHITMTEKFGRIVNMILGFQFTMVVSDTKFLEFVMSSNKLIDKAQVYKYAHKWLGMGLLTSTGLKWKQRRKMITPAFHFQILEGFIEIFDRNGDILIEKLSKINDKVDIYNFLNMYALDVICESAMGTNINAQSNTDSQYVNCVKTMCRIMAERSFAPLQQIELLYLFHPNYWIERKCVNILHSYTKKVIKNRRQTIIEGDDRSNKRIAFLDLLLKSTIDGNPLSDEDIREEVDTFMFEGHDTITTALNFTIYSICTHSEIQDRIIAEQKQIFGTERNRRTTINDLNEMKYLEMVIKESLRMYPSVPNIGRTFVEDCKYNDEITIRAGTQLDIFVYGVHYNPDDYPDPNKFDPERFTPENQSKRGPFCYIPFSAGPRNCIGQKFAMMEMKCVLSKLLRFYEVVPTDPPHKIELKAETLMKSKNGNIVKLRHRNWT